MEVTDSDKHSSLQRHGINHGRMIYDTGPRKVLIFEDNLIDGGLSREPLLKGKALTIDLLVLAGIDLLLFTLKILLILV